VCASSSAWLSAQPGLLAALRSRPHCEAHDLGGPRPECACAACGRGRHVSMLLTLSGAPVEPPPGCAAAGSPGAARGGAQGQEEGRGQGQEERQQYYVGSFCAARLSLYHCLHHFARLLGWKLQRERLRALAHARAVGGGLCGEAQVAQLVGRLEGALYQGFRDLCDAADALASSSGGGGGAWRGGGGTLAAVESVLLVLA
jgi:hypothetical protein